MTNMRTKITTTTMTVANTTTTVADSAHTRDAGVRALAPLDDDNDDAGLLDDTASLDPFSGPAPYSSLFSPFSYSTSAYFDFEGDSFLDFERDSLLGSEGDSFSLRSPICRDGRFGCAGSAEPPVCAGSLGPLVCAGSPGSLVCAGSPGPLVCAGPPGGAGLPFGGDGPGLYQLFGFGLRAPAPITPFLAGESDREEAGEPDMEEAGEPDTEEAGGCWQDHDMDKAGEEDVQLVGGAEQHLGGAPHWGGAEQHLGGVECSETAWEDMSAFICDDAHPVLIDRSPLRLIARDAGGEAALDAAWDRIRRYESSDDSDLDSSLGDDDGYSSLDDSYSDDLLDDSQDESGLDSSLDDDSGSFALGSLPDTDRLSCAFDLWRLGLDFDRPSSMRLEEVAHVLAEEPTSESDGSSSPSETSITFGSLPDTDGFSCTSGLWRLALGADGGE